MVQAIENWTSIAGRVRAVADDSLLDGYKRVAVEVEHVAPVAQFESLVQAATGEIVEILVPADTAGSMASGQRITARVRRAARGIFAHPDETKLG
ncbi:MAG TPA: hypothetical protein VHL59_02160 [Thermoanaerobaculia bacterium]|nr:hypothetical protein [Thermoanaerobaculia bacterium]